MYRGRHIVVVIPAHNEALHLRNTLRTIPQFVDDVVVVNDASTDDTQNIAASYPVTLISHPVRSGVGQAIRSGYRQALALGADICAVMAGDGQMDPAELSGLIDALIVRGHDYVKGDRVTFLEMNKQASMPVLRNWGTRFFSLWTNLICGLTIRDAQSGYTVATRAAMVVLNTRTRWRGYGYPNAFIFALTQSGLSLSEVPIRPIYEDERSGLGLRHAFVTIPLLLMWLSFKRMLAVGAKWSRKKSIAPTLGDAHLNSKSHLNR